MHLLSSHWNRQHHSFLITYRPAFMRDMACQGPYFSRLLLNAIYFAVSKFSSRVEVRSDPTDPRTAGWAFRQRTKDLLASEIEKSEIPTIQALLVLTSSLFALGEEKNVAWMYAGLAFKMIVDLGMHRAELLPSANSRLSDEDLEVRRRVFWAAFGETTLELFLVDLSNQRASGGQSPVPLSGSSYHASILRLPGTAGIS